MSEDGVEIPARYAIDSETGRQHFSLERLPMPQIKQAFIDEFKQYKPNIAAHLDLLEKNTEYVDFIDKNEADIGGLSTSFYRASKDEHLTHQTYVPVTENPNQDQHTLTHEYIHGLNVGDLGKEWQDGPNKKRILYGRVGPLRKTSIMTINANGAEHFESYGQATYTPEELRLWECFTEWKARRMSLKYFPDKFDDFHTSFDTGYQGVSLIEWLEEQAIQSGNGEQFTHAANLALVNGQDREIMNVLESLFPGKQVYKNLLETLSKELVVEAEIEAGKVSLEQGVTTIREQVYGDLIGRLTT
jgi:hypothetical protein